MPKPTPPAQQPPTAPAPKAEAPTNVVKDVSSANQQTSSTSMNVTDRSYRIHIIK